MDRTPPDCSFSFVSPLRIQHRLLWAALVAEPSLMPRALLGWDCSWLTPRAAGKGHPKMRRVCTSLASAAGRGPSKRLLDFWFTGLWEGDVLVQNTGMEKILASAWIRTLESSGSASSELCPFPFPCPAMGWTPEGKIPALGPSGSLELTGAVAANKIRCTWAEIIRDSPHPAAGAGAPGRSCGARENQHKLRSFKGWCQNPLPGSVLVTHWSTGSCFLS